MWEVAAGARFCGSSPISTAISFPLFKQEIETSEGVVEKRRFQNVIQSSSNNKNYNLRKRVFFLDVNPLRYNGNKPSLHSFAHWLSLFFSQVSLQDPVIAVIDGEGGNEFRRKLLPSYKAHRRKFSPQRFSRSTYGSDYVPFITDVLQNCNVPVLKIKDYEADDVVATLVDQVLKRGFRVVIGSPDKDFKQLISEDVQIVMPMPEFGRWSFYTLKHYIAQYNCYPSSDLSLRYFFNPQYRYAENNETNAVTDDIRKGLKRVIEKLCDDDNDACKAIIEIDTYGRMDGSFGERIARKSINQCNPGCIVGDEVDGVPGIQHLVPGFGRKTVLKLLKKHGSLENLLNAAAVRTVGKQYAQDALTKHADFLRKNYEVLSLRRDVDVHLEEEWLTERDNRNDSVILSRCMKRLERLPEN